jgi:hypothetical protein
MSKRLVETGPQGPSVPDAKGVPESFIFTSEQRSALEKLGYVIYNLTGVNTFDLTRERGLKIGWYNGRPPRWAGYAPEYENSMKSEVAINPKSFLLPKSNECSYNDKGYERQRMVFFLGKQIEYTIPGITAKIGRVPDYAELYVEHQEATGKRLWGHDYKHDIKLLGREYNHEEIYTHTSLGNLSVTIASVYGGGLEVSTFNSYLGKLVWAAPLLVPKLANEA